MTTNKEKLSQKITSYEQLQAIYGNDFEYKFNYGCTPSGDSTCKWDEDNDLFGRTGGAWWITREMMREEEGVYPAPTSVILWLRNRGLAKQYWPHVSKTDPTRIAYTPDTQSGLADRQVVTTIGRFLRKYCILLSDAFVARLESDHRAEMDDEFQLATTMEEIEHVYTHMNGDTGCMRYSRDQFSNEDYHPSAVYAAPGIGVAYIKNNEGKITARTVVYVNPEDPTDKRYVRLYGAPLLKAKLERLGYRNAGLAGVYIRALKDPSFDDRFNVTDRARAFVMPYLDAPGGNGSGVYDKLAVGLAYDTSRDAILMLDQDGVKRFRNAGVSISDSVRGTSGVSLVPHFDGSTMEFTCFLSGEKCSRMTHQLAWLLDDEGKLQTVDAVRMYAISDLYTQLYNHKGDANVMVNVKLTEYRDRSLEKHGFGGWLDTPQNRAHLGILELSTAFYPEGTISQRNETTRTIINGEEHIILADDAVRVYHKDGTCEMLHTSLAAPLKKAGYVTVHAIEGVKLLAHKEHSGLATTRSGRRVIENVHEVSRLLDGTLEFNRNSQEIVIFGKSYRVHRDDVWSDVTVPVERFREDMLMAHYLAQYGKAEYAQIARRVLHSGTQYGRGFEFVKGDGGEHVAYTSAWHSSNHAGRVRAASELQVWIDEQFIAAGINANLGRFWARNAYNLIEAYASVLRDHEIQQAEAAALDYTRTEGRGTAADMEAAKARAAQTIREVLASTDELFAVAA